MESLQDYTRIALAEIHQSPHKKLSQNFLIDEQVLGDIIKAASLQPTDNILEIGPGLGVLTRELLKHAKSVVSVEYDQALADQLAKIRDNKLTVVSADIKEFDISTMPKSYKVVANIPYHLTGYIIRKFTETHRTPLSMTLLVQKEVAERLAAEPGAMSVLSLLVQMVAEVHYVRTVPSISFWPVPKVDSAVVHIVFDSSKKIDDTVLRIIKIGFAAKRKTLKNNLLSARLVNTEQCDSILSTMQLSPTVRAQELSLAQWRVLSNMLAAV